ncbi:hypothetical protein EHS39_34235 [Ensifer sp. MPMI2T]|nr:hypothetical protein EHS39_34235 [Ensifer sp. MPMI2T]
MTWHILAVTYQFEGAEIDQVDKIIDETVMEMFEGKKLSEVLDHLRVREYLLPKPMKSGEIGTLLSKLVMRAVVELELYFSTWHPRPGLPEEEDPKSVLQVSTIVDI